MTFIKAAELCKKVLDDYNAAMEAKDMKEKAYYAAMEFKHGGQEKAYYEKMAAQREEMLGKKPWVGLTGTEINHIVAANVGYPKRMMQEVEAKLKDKNCG